MNVINVEYPLNSTTKMMEFNLDKVQGKIAFMYGNSECFLTSRAKSGVLSRSMNQQKNDLTVKKGHRLKRDGQHQSPLWRV